MVLFCVMYSAWMFMDGIGMLLLTLPVIQSVMINLVSKKNTIWFGVIVVKMVEIGLRAAGRLNCYVVAGVRPDVPRRNLSRHITKSPSLICVLILLCVPGIVTFLPNLVGLKSGLLVHVIR